MTPKHGKWRHRLAEAAVALGILAVPLAMIAAGVDRVREAAARSSCNLGGVMMALRNYESVHGGLPPAVLYGKDGTPLHSWRVLILPYIEEDNLFKEFRLDEPWDSPHNLALLPRMPRSYAAPGHKESLLAAHHTMLNVFVGEGTPFEQGKKVKFDDFGDGTQTLLFVEAGEAVPWTKPNYLSYDPHGPLPPLPGLFRDVFRSCLMAGPYRYIRKDTSPGDLRALITRYPFEPNAPR